MAQNPYNFDWLFAQSSAADPQEPRLSDSDAARRGIDHSMESVFRGVLGLGPTQQDNRQMAGHALRELAQQMRPGTVEFYQAGADILRRYGQIAQADVMMHRARELELGKSENSEVLKLQQVRDQLQRRYDAGELSVKNALDAVDRQLAQLGVPKAASAAAGTKLQQLIAARNATQDPEERTLYQRAIEAELAGRPATGVMTDYQRAQLERNNALDAERAAERQRKAAEAQAKTVSALHATVRGVDKSISDATRLLQHPGLNTITGPVNGGVPLEQLSLLGGDAAGAAALYRQMQGATFLAALNELKQQSRTGATGLGQLTEIEGEKIQNAAAALHRQQPYAQFKRTLQGYIGQLQAARATAAQELSGVGARVPAPAAPISDSPADIVLRSPPRRSAPRGGWSISE